MPSSSHSGGTSVSSAEIFLEYLGRQLWKIAFPLSPVLAKKQNNKINSRCRVPSEEIYQTNKAMQHLYIYDQERTERTGKPKYNNTSLRQPRQFLVRVGCAGSNYVVGLVPCYPVCRLLPPFNNRGFPTTASPTVPISSDATTHNGSAVLPTMFRLIVRNTSDRGTKQECILNY